MVGGGYDVLFLALIPKEKRPYTFLTFHPISLCNMPYKILMKIIGSRFKIILPTLISKNQGGFVHQRKMLDNFIVV